MNSKKYIFFVLIFMGGCMLSACITDKYDFDKDVNLGLSIAEDGFLLPGESDIDIPMSQMIELKDNSELQIDSLTGNYLFYKMKDDMDTMTVCIAHGSLCEGTMDDLDYPLQNNPAVVLTPNKRYPEFASLSFETVISPSFSPDVLKNSIRELFYMEVNLDIVVTMYFSNIEGFSYFNELKYEVPFFYVVSDEADLIENNVKAEGMHTHIIHVKGVDFTRTSPYSDDVIGIDPETRRIMMHGDVRIKGNTKTVNIAAFEASPDATIFYRTTIGTLATLGVTGRFDQQEIVEMDAIQFDNLPDFIKDEEVFLDLENPTIRLSLWNEFPASISLNAVLTGMRDGNPISSLSIGADYNTSGITFQGPEFGTEDALQTNIWVSRIPVVNLPDSVSENVVIPEVLELPHFPILNQEDSVSENVVIPEVMDIVRRMPDKIMIDAYARSDSSKVITMSLSEEYKAVPRYELIVPLKMGRDMKIVYNKDFENLNRTLKHVDLREVVITAQVENHLPMDLSMKMQAFSCDGTELQGLAFDLPSVENPIPGLIEGASLSTGSKDITIRIKNSGKEDCLHQIDHLRLKVFALSSAALEGQYLNRNQNLQLRNIKLLLR